MLLKRESCPACDQSDSFSELYACGYEDQSLNSFLKSYYASYDEALLSGDRFQVDFCTNCKLVFQRFVPDAALLQIVYDQWIGVKTAPSKPYRPSRVGRDAHELFSVAKYFRRPMKELEVFDYGMGLAKWCQTALMLGFKTYGFDLSDARLEYARKLGIETVTWGEIPEGKFDFVNTEQVFEHLTDPFNVISRLANSLKPDGVLKISVPFAGNMAERLRQPDWNARRYTRKSLNPVQPLEHVNCFSVESVAALGARVGLKRVNPSWMQSYAFLFEENSIPWGKPKKLVRPFLRPFYKRFFAHKLYVWLKKEV